MRMLYTKRIAHSNDYFVKRRCTLYENLYSLTLKNYDVHLSLFSTKNISKKLCVNKRFLTKDIRGLFLFKATGSNAGS